MAKRNIINFEKMFTKLDDKMNTMKIFMDHRIGAVLAYMMMTFWLFCQPVWKKVQYMN